MWVPFQDLDPTSKVWIFQSDRRLTETDESTINIQLKSFITDWSTHGAPMRASYEFRKGCFVIIAADEQVQSASGCSIGAFTALFKKFESELGLSFFDRFAMAYNSEKGVEVVSLSKFKELIASDVITENTIVYNNLVATKDALLESWEIPVKSSWQKRYL